MEKRNQRIKKKEGKRQHLVDVGARWSGTEQSARARAHVGAASPSLKQSFPPFSSRRAKICRRQPTRC